MRFDPRTAAITLAIAWLSVSALSAAVWWTRRRHGGFGRFALAGPGTVLLLFLSLRHAASDSISVLGANAVLALASAWYLEGARAFRGQPPRRWPVYAGASRRLASSPSSPTRLAA